MAMTKEILEWAIKENEKETSAALQAEKFWRDRYNELAQQVMQAAGLPDDFQNYGLDSAFKKIKGIS